MLQNKQMQENIYLIYSRYIMLEIHLRDNEYSWHISTHKYFLFLYFLILLDSKNDP